MEAKLDRKDSVTLYRFKKLIKELESKVGRGTELISIYIPPKKPISEVIGYLRQEYATAANIKSKTTRKNVRDAIESAIQRLKLFDRAGPTGLIIFSGAIPQNGGPGSEKIEVYHIIRPEPINILLYRCDSRFYLEPLKDLLREKDVYGILVIDNEKAAVAVAKGRRIAELKTFTSGVPGKHRA
ncbi:MAG: peptide chain release factor 1, partial [Thaumarchaeota archaeon]